MKKVRSPQRCPLADKTIRERDNWQREADEYRAANPFLGFKQRLLRDLYKLNS